VTAVIIRERNFILYDEKNKKKIIFFILYKKSCYNKMSRYDTYEDDDDAYDSDYSSEYDDDSDDDSDSDADDEDHYLGGGAGDKKRRRKPRTDNFNVYIHKVLKQVQPQMRISKKSMNVMNGLLMDTLNRLAAVGGEMAKKDHKETLTDKDIQSAVKIVFPGQLSNHAVSEGTKALAISKREEEAPAPARGSKSPAAPKKLVDVAGKAADKATAAAGAAKKAADRAEKSASPVVVRIAVKEAEDAAAVAADAADTAAAAASRTSNPVVEAAARQAGAAADAAAASAKKAAAPPKRKQSRRRSEMDNLLNPYRVKK
jgi:histone H2B